MNALPHPAISHSCGRSPVCVRSCSASLLGELHVKLHQLRGHLYRRIDRPVVPSRAQPPLLLLPAPHAASAVLPSLPPASSRRRFMASVLPSSEPNQPTAATRRSG